MDLLNVKLNINMLRPEDTRVGYGDHHTAPTYLFSFLLLLVYTIDWQ